MSCWQLSLLGGALPMFELVEQQPSHLACPDVLNLSLGESHAWGHISLPGECGLGQASSSLCLPQGPRQLL